MGGKLNRFSIPILGIALTVSVALIGCGTAPRPTPALTSTPVVITVVVTATPPVTAAVEASPVVTSTVTLSGTQTLLARATNTPGTPRATRRPTTPTPVPTATATPYPLKYSQAVKLIGPVFEGNNPGERRDEAHYPTDALVFEWLSNGPLGGGECYQVRVDIKSNADGSVVGDSFIQCDPQETQKGGAQTVRFILNKPSGPGPTYATLIPRGGGDLTVSWSVTIVRDEGPTPSGGAYAADGSRHKVIPISPRSSIYSFPLKGVSP